MIEFLEALLVRCEELAEGRDWTQVAVGARDMLDAIRSAVATEPPGIAVFDFAAETVHAHLTTVGAAFDDVDPLVAAVACARAVDDIWGDDLAAEWAELLASRGNYDDWRFAPAANFADDFQSVHVRQTKVEQDQLGIIRCGK